MSENTGRKLHKGMGKTSDSPISTLTFLMSAKAHSVSPCSCATESSDKARKATDVCKSRQKLLDVIPARHAHSHTPCTATPSICCGCSPKATLLGSSCSSEEQKAAKDSAELSRSVEDAATTAGDGNVETNDDEEGILEDTDKDCCCCFCVCRVRPPECAEPAASTRPCCLCWATPTPDVLGMLPEAR